MSKAVPVICGTGLIALDVVVTPSTTNPPRFWAGGTCGNVLAILGFLGWKPVAVGRLETDPAGEFVSADLARWHVDVRNLSLKPQCSTPIIVEEISKNKAGLPRHRYLWTCPDCGAYLPTFRAIPIQTAHKLDSELSVPSVFFFDRVSPGILTLARRFAREGSIIFFEPSASGEPKHFQEAVRLAHVLKYSHQRVRGFVDLLAKSSPVLQIETLGEDGLRFRTAAGNGQWTEMPSFDIPVVRDTAGSGDWCSAGIISQIGTLGPSGLAKIGRTDLNRALRYGQALAAWNCGFEGARGGMYRTTPMKFHQAIKKILGGVGVQGGRTARRLHHTSASLQTMCPRCDIATNERRRPAAAAG
ncbi:MAG: PfkB family carbohydrate kinase [Vicinamibacterales bacterium]